MMLGQGFGVLAAVWALFKFEEYSSWATEKRD